MAVVNSPCTDSVEVQDRARKADLVGRIARFWCEQAERCSLEARAKVTHSQATRKGDMVRSEARVIHRSEGKLGQTPKIKRKQSQAASRGHDQEGVREISRGKLSQ